MLHRSDDVEYLTAEDLQEQSRYEGQLLFAGVEDHYFLVGRTARHRTRDG